MNGGTPGRARAADRSSRRTVRQGTCVALVRGGDGPPLQPCRHRARCARRAGARAGEGDGGGGRETGGSRRDGHGSDRGRNDAVANDAMGAGLSHWGERGIRVARPGSRRGARRSRVRRLARRARRRDGDGGPPAPRAERLRRGRSSGVDPARHVRDVDDRVADGDLRRLRVDDELCHRRRLLHPRRRIGAARCLARGGRRRARIDLRSGLPPHALDPDH